MFFIFSLFPDHCSSSVELVFLFYELCVSSVSGFLGFAGSLNRGSLGFLVSDWEYEWNSEAHRCYIYWINGLILGISV